MRARRFAQKKLWLWLPRRAGWLRTGICPRIFGLAAAVLGASFAGCEPGSEPALAASTGPTPSAYALQSIPPERLRLYEQAGSTVRHRLELPRVDRRAGVRQRRLRRDQLLRVRRARCRSPTSAGSPCSPGPGPTLWERYAVIAHPGQAPSVNDPADAIYTAARILREDMGAPPTGGTYAEYRAGGVPLLRRVRRRNGQLRRRGDGPRRAIRVHRHRAHPPPTSPPLAATRHAAAVAARARSRPKRQAARRSSGSLKASSARASTPKAPTARSTGRARSGARCSPHGFGSTRACRSPAPPPLYGYSGSLYTWAREHGGRVLPPTATPGAGRCRSSTAHGPSESAHVGIVAKVLAGRGDRPRSRATTPGASTRVSASFSPGRPRSARRPRLCMGMRGRPPAAAEDEVVSGEDRFRDHLWGPSEGPSAMGPFLRLPSALSENRRLCAAHGLVFSAGWLCDISMPAGEIQ